MYAKPCNDSCKSISEEQAKCIKDAVLKLAGNTDKDDITMKLLQFAQGKERC